jgi:hypothetical protein
LIRILEIAIVSAMAGNPSFARNGVRDVFYETRAVMGRDYTVRRFALEVLGGSVHPLILGYIEKGKRLPTEALVRRLAAVRKEDPEPLLALLWRDRMLHAFSRELNRVLGAPRGVQGIEDAELAVVISQAIAALPDDGTWIDAAKWRRGFSVVRQRRRPPRKVAAPILAQAEDALRQRNLIEEKAQRVRLRSYHFVAASKQERHSLAVEYCALFAKGLLDKLALSDVDTGTYLRNHYLHIEPEKLSEFQRRLHESVDALSAEYATPQAARTRFLNVLVVSTTLE